MVINWNISTYKLGAKRKQLNVNKLQVRMALRARKTL